MSCDLVVFVTREASLPGGSNLAVSRFIQQVEPTWQAAWCHKAEDHHIRTAQLSSKDADTAELSNHLLTRAVAVILLSWDDIRKQAFPDSHLVLLFKMERILGSLPIIAVVGHEESRGCTELCWPDILNLVKKRAAGERFVNSYLFSFHQRMNKSQQNMFFSIFASIACQDIEPPQPVESITVLSEDNSSLQNFCRHLDTSLGEGSLEKKPVRQLCIMSRDDEFSLNAKSLYIVAISGDASVIFSNNPDGDYRMILHRILFHTGRLPIIALVGPESNAQKLEEIAGSKYIGSYMRHASCFSDQASPAQTEWLVSALQCERGRIKPPGTFLPHGKVRDHSSLQVTALDDSTQSASPSRIHSTPSQKSSLSSLQKQISDIRSQIRGLKSGDGENCEENTTRSIPPELPHGAFSTSSVTPSRDTKKALHSSTPLTGKATTSAHQTAFCPEDLVSDFREARPAKSYTEILLSNQDATSQPAGLKYDTRTREFLGQQPSAAVISAKKSTSPHAAAFNIGKPASYVDAWNNLEKIKQNHEGELLKGRIDTSTSAAGDQSSETKTDACDRRSEADHLQMRIQEEIDVQNARLERLKLEAQHRARTADEELRRVVSDNQDSDVRKEVVQGAVYCREVEAKVLFDGVQPPQRVREVSTTFQDEIIYQVPSPLSDSPEHGTEGEQSAVPAQIPSPDKYAAIQTVDRIGRNFPDRHQNNGSNYRNTPAKVALESNEDSALCNVVGTASGSRHALSNQLRQSASSDHETLPHERSPPDDYEAPLAVAKDHSTPLSRPLVLSASAQHPARSEAFPKCNANHGTPIAPRVLIPKDRDSPKPIPQDLSVSGVFASGSAMPRVIPRRPSLANQDAAPSPSVIREQNQTPKVLSHRPTMSADCTPIGSPRLRSSDDPQSLPVGEESAVCEGVEDGYSDYCVSGPPLHELDTKECCDYPASPAIIRGKVPSPNLLPPSPCLLRPSFTPSPQSKTADDNLGSSKKVMNLCLSSASENGDSNPVGIGMTLSRNGNSEVVVADIDRFGPAAKSLIRVGDIICSIDGKDVKRMDEGTAQSLLFGNVHSAVILGIKHSNAGNEMSDVVIIRSAQSNDRRVASHAVEVEDHVSLQHSISCDFKPPADSDQPGSLWASLRAQVDMFANAQAEDDQVLGDYQVSETNTCGKEQDDRPLPLGGQVHQGGTPVHGYLMMQHGQGQHGPLPPPSHHRLGFGSPYLSSSSSMPADRMPPSSAPPHPHSQMGPPRLPPHVNMQQGQVQQPAWHGNSPHKRYPQTGLPHAHSQQVYQTPQKMNQHQQNHRNQRPSSVGPLCTPLQSSQTNSQTPSQITPGAYAGTGSLRSTEYSWMQHVEMSRSPHPAQHTPHQPPVMGQCSYPPESPKVGMPPTSPKSRFHAHVNHNNTPQPMSQKVSAQVQKPYQNDQLSESLHSSPPSENMNMNTSSEEDIDVVDIPVDKLQNSSPENASKMALTLPSTSSNSTSASDPERGDFGFQVMQMVDKKYEMKGEYDSMRVSSVAHEGSARFSGQVIRGDYLLRVNQVDLRSKPLNEVLDILQSAPAKSTFCFFDAKGKRRTVTLVRESRSREDMFIERMHRMRSGATDLQYLAFLRRTSSYAGREDLRPSFVVCGFPGVGKSTLINTMLGAINSSDYSVADASTPTMEYTRYEQVLRGADNNPFIIADTAGLTGDETVFASLRNIIKGRQKNNTKMDNSWRSTKTVADQRKRAHGLILVADVRQKVSNSIVDALDEMCRAEDDLPVVVAWTNVHETSMAEAIERMRSMLIAFPRAVNFPVMHYAAHRSSADNVDYTVLDMLSHLRTQSLRYVMYAHQEASVKA